MVRSRIMENAIIEKKKIGDRDFVVVRPLNNSMIIDYQLLMIAGNRIPGYLEVTRRQDNDKIYLLYDVTDKISLKEITENRKLSKTEFSNVIEAVLRAAEDGRSYQLANKGLIIDPEYIYLSKKNTEVGLIYLPFYNDDVNASMLQNLIRDFIMDGKIEKTNDIYLSKLIDVVNIDNLSFKDLSLKVRNNRNEGVKSHRENNPREQERKIVRSEPVRRIDNKVPINKVSNSINNNTFHDTENHEADKNLKSSKNKLIFILLCVAVVVIIGILYIKGAFLVDGVLKPEYLAVAFIAGGALLFIIYREMFINSKKKDKGSDKKTTDKKNGAKGSTPKPVPGMKKPSMPGKPSLSVRPPAENIRSQVPAKPIQTVNQVKQDVDYDDNNDTVIIDNIGESGPYLEYFNNGISNKIYIEGSSILVGKQRSRVNYSIPDNTVSKVHAEFGVNDNGYYVKDYASTNGTYINDGSRLIPNKQYSIENGDVIKLAKVELVFHC